MLIGIITTKGVSKTIDLVNEEGYKIVPYKFAVTEQIGDLLPSRTIDDLLPAWFTGTISSAEKIDENTVQFNCNIPAQVSPEPRFTKEVYLIAKDENDEDFLLGLAQPTSELTYDPEGELRIRVRFTLDNVSIGDVYTFKYTQATEISDHNVDPNAHPLIVSNLNKHGIYLQQPLNKFNGQNVDTYPTVGPTVINRNAVYFNALTNRYEPAIVEPSSRRFAIGFYLSEQRIVVTGGIIDFPNSLNPYTPVYLSDNIPGLVGISATSVRMGYSLPNNKLLVQVAIVPDLDEPNPDGDFIYTIVPPLIRQLTLEDANGVRWDVRVDNDGLLVTVPNSTREPDPLFRIPKIDISFAQLGIKTDGELIVYSPPLDFNILQDAFYYLQSPNGLAWKITIDLSNNIVMESYQNIFLVESELASHFAVRQLNSLQALTYLQVFEELPSEPPVLEDLSPLGIVKDKDGKERFAYFNGTEWVKSNPKIKQVAYLSDVKTANTGGGSSTTTYTPRVINSITDPNAIVLNDGDFSGINGTNDNFELAKGVYSIIIHAPHRTANESKLRLRNMTKDENTLIGDSSGGKASLMGIFEVTEESEVFQIQHRATSVVANGFGIPANLGEPEVYTTCMIEKLDN